MLQEKQRPCTKILILACSLMRKTDFLALAFGAAMLLVAVPVLMRGLQYFCDLEFLPSESISCLLATLCSSWGLILIMWSNYALLSRGHGGAAVIGKIKLMQETRALVTTGPYALCRNPMHLGLVFYYLGIACFLNSLLCLSIPVLTGVVAFLFAVYIDEPRLKRDFGDAYERWSAKVPRFLPSFPLQK